MGVRLLTILALVVGSRAFEFGAVDAVTDALHAFHSESFASFFSEHIRPNLLSLHALVRDDPETCDQCKEDGAKYIIEHAAAMMKEKCTAVSDQNCKAAKICGWLGAHPEVALGMMIEKVRPMALTTAYCYGKGVCKPEKSTMKEILTGHEAHAAVLENFDKVDWTEALDEVKEVNQIEEEKDAPHDSRCAEESDMPKVCPMCMKTAMRRVMGHVIMKVKGMCENTKCPKMQKLCPWMNEHKEVTLGMLLMKVQPWKFALGFCMHGMMEHHGKPHEPHGFQGFHGLHGKPWHSVGQWQQQSQMSNVPMLAMQFLGKTSEVIMPATPPMPPMPPPRWQQSQMSEVRMPPMPPPMAPRTIHVEFISV